MDDAIELAAALLNAANLTAPCAATALAAACGIVCRPRPGAELRVVLLTSGAELFYDALARDVGALIARGVARWALMITKRECTAAAEETIARVLCGSGGMMPAVLAL